MCAFRIGCSYIPLPRCHHQFRPWMMEMRCSDKCWCRQTGAGSWGVVARRWLQERLLGKVVCAGGITGQHGGWWGWAVTAPHPLLALGWFLEADVTWPFREPCMICGSRETPWEPMYRMLHHEPPCDYLLLICHQARWGLRTRRTIGLLGDWHEH